MIASISDIAGRVAVAGRAPSVAFREERACERQQDAARRAAENEPAHGGGAALPGEPRRQQREARCEMERAKDAGDEQDHQCGPECVHQPEGYAQRRPHEQADEEQPLRTMAVGKIAGRYLRERVAQHAGGREHAGPGIVDSEIFAYGREQERDRGEGQEVRDLAQHQQPDGDDPVASQRPG
jgi:hypothetical protein